MNCNIFCILDKGIPSGHLNGDGVGSLCQEGEGNAAVQGDEGLKDSRKTNVILCGIWDVLLYYKSQMVIILYSICISSRGPSMKKEKRKLHSFLKLWLYPVSRKSIQTLKKHCTMFILSDEDKTGHPGFCLSFCSFSWGKVEATFVTSFYWLWEEIISVPQYSVLLVFSSCIRLDYKTIQRSDLILFTSVSPILGILSYIQHNRYVGCMQGHITGF